jgi:ADP-heptose:LPS heptosyltransferase
VRHGNDFAYTLALPPRDGAVHIVDKLGALLPAFGIEPSAADLRPRITLTAAERDAGARAWAGATEADGARRVRLLVNVSAGVAIRRWPDERFVRVVQFVRERVPGSVDVAFIGSPAERKRSERIARASQARLVDTPSLRDAFGVVAASDVVFTPDTSIVHAASAFAIPAAVLFPRGKPALWGQYGVDGWGIESPTTDIEPIAADDAARGVVGLVQAAGARAGRA